MQIENALLQRPDCADKSERNDNISDIFAYTCIVCTLICRKLTWMVGFPTQVDAEEETFNSPVTSHIVVSFCFNL